MFSSEIDRFLLKTLAAWFLLATVLVFSAGVLPALLKVPALAALLALSYWCVDCAFRTEHFRKFAKFRLFTNLALAPGWAFLTALVTTYKELKLAPVISLALSCVPLIIAGAAYVAMFSWRSQRSNLQIRGQRVYSIETEQASSNKRLLGGLGAGLGSLLYPVFHAYSTSSSMLVFIFIIISLFMIFYHRSSISALRSLKEQEVRESCRYTFMNIEEIREKRAASLVGRLFAAKADR